MELSHDNPALLHPVLQLNLDSVSDINFHSTTPAAVHAFSVDMAIVLLKPFSPGANTPYVCIGIAKMSARKYFTITVMDVGKLATRGWPKGPQMWIYS
jgi:hypothetical protein